MLPWLTIGHAIALVYLSAQAAPPPQVPALLAVDEQVLREYAGTYQWDQTRRRLCAGLGRVHRIESAGGLR